MFIYQFNRLIRSRILWGVFAVVVALAFVGVPVATHLEQKGEQGPVVGKLNGEKIRRQDFDRVRFFVETLELGRDHDLEPSEINRQVWQRLAALETARNLGLTATDAEVAGVIRQDPAFRHENRFNRELYQAILWRQLRIEPADYERFTSDRITLRKIADLLASASWVPPSAVQHQIRNLTDRFSLSYVALSNRFAEVEIPVSSEDIYTYYTTNRESFRLPARRSVVYARFPVSNHLAEVSVEDDEISEFYENMAHRYMRPGTNGVDETLPLNEVSGEIESELRHEKARYTAMSAAMNLLEGIDRDTRENALSAQAPAAGATVHTSELFTVSQTPSGIDTGAEFAEAAFNLDPTRQNYRFSDIISGSSNIYVMAMHSNSPPAIQPFEAAEPAARRVVEITAREDAFENFLMNIHSNIAAAVNDMGSSFSNAVVEAGLPPATNLAFTAIEAFQSESPNAAAIARAVTAAEDKKLLEPRRTRDGALLIYVENREPGDPLSAEMLRGEIRQQIQRYRGLPLMEEWLRWNFEQIGAIDPTFQPAGDGEREDFPDEAY